MNEYIYFKFFSILDRCLNYENSRRDAFEKQGTAGGQVKKERKAALEAALIEICF
ncbi:MAG: hypothetical protein ACOX7X_09565 [Methanosarcina flavescens]|uniref:PTS sugar transporter n=1 Tax=Methanosarcina thermophila TaxID=2210 RepID=A0A3G9CWS7_METTE|nr:hypothetical protein [Methanosarcina thermophila]NLU56765.1 hypothetical protein [Methanosarcina thermophila]BAW29449.1 PTS sugar transporter [Methanosarcina thermophila]GLI13506.1 hypothetical protein MTHERMMSTA1_06320 [Methanosarcina thermophila MST-A1]HPZ19469.1 hypothetical protein [Methanosarcina thermophila]HQD93859.1 hypothetical protein [Methanosarcina thermophila]